MAGDQGKQHRKELKQQLVDSQANCNSLRHDLEEAEDEIGRLKIDHEEKIDAFQQVSWAPPLSSSSPHCTSC